MGGEIKRNLMELKQTQKVLEHYVPDGIAALSGEYRLTLNRFVPTGPTINSRLGANS